ncbi:interleukin-18 receptor 1-like [Chiloscyllium punctatum]|uniref:interleukin-18 receptor 1-like n=1 Tax=Chiloscyllium punctatum TaxID=137246 RepID=UPI003B6340E2
MGFNSKCVEGCMPKRSICMFPNWKPWMKWEIHYLLKTRHTAFKSDDPDLYKKSRYDLCKAISDAKINTGNFPNSKCNVITVVKQLKLGDACEIFDSGDLYLVPGSNSSHDSEEDTHPHQRITTDITENRRLLALRDFVEAEINAWVNCDDIGTETLSNDQSINIVMEEQRGSTDAVDAKKIPILSPPPVSKYIEPFKPKLIYPIDEQIELGLGEKREIECKAIANKEAVDFCVLFWNFNHNYLTSGGNDVYENSSRIVPEDNRVSVIAPLVFMKIKKEHLNKTFQCVLTCQDTQQIGNIILLEKGKGDTDPVVLPIIMAVAVFISVAVVYVKFKIYFVLCFRDFISRDETLEDSKEYDAYVLLLKSNDAVLSAKEETFALEVLPSILEEKFGYRLCIFERDVLPGGASANDMLSCINKCRRLIIILCAECVAEDSSMYELMTGLHQALVNRLIKPILIEYNPIRDVGFLPQSLQLILRSNRRVKWRSTSLSQNSYFWKKIRYLMPAKHI